RVDGVLELEDLAADVDGDLLGEVTVGHRHRHLGDVPHLGGEIARHLVHVVGEVLPGAGHPCHHRLAAELALGADLTAHRTHLGGVGVALPVYGVDGVLQLEDLAVDVDGDLAGQVAAGHRGGHLGDVADLAGEVGGHEVDVIGEVLPGAGHARHHRLPAQLPVGAHLAGHPGHLGGKGVELVDHGVDGV